MAAGAKTLLVVEDDPSLLVFAQRYLHHAGHEVISCRGARDAWAKYAADPETPVLALIDVTLQDESGEQLALRMLSLNPRLRLLFWSGYPFDIERFVGSCGFPVRGEFLLKPFAPGALLAAVDRLLES